MIPEEMAEVRPRLEAFAAGMFAGFARADQRAKGELYLRGLMLDGQRKSMQPMACVPRNSGALEAMILVLTWGNASRRP